jgi:hypothetical protein
MITPSFGLTATERVLPKLALDFTTANLDNRVTFARTTSASNPATYVNSSGVVVAATNDQPRFDFDSVTLACKGLLVEESRQNICLQSQTFNTGSWFKGQTSVDPDSAISPDGTQNADKLVENTANSAHRIYQTITVLANTTYTTSFFVNAAGRTKCRVRDYANPADYSAIFDLSLGTVQSQSVVGIASITAFKDGWYRCSVRVLTGAAQTSLWPAVELVTSTSTTTYTGNGTSGVYLWGAQLEAGAFATSYIPTTTTALTRNADVATITGTSFSDFWQAAKGGASVLATPSTVSGTRPLVQFDDNTADEIIALRSNTTNPELYIVDGGTPQAQIDAGTIAAVTAYSLTGWWQENNSFAQLNTQTSVRDNTVTIPTVTQARIGSDGTNYLNGTIAAIYYYDELANSIYDSLRLLGYTGTVTDMLLQYYLARGATSNSLTDAEIEFLGVKGFTTGTIDDRWTNYLISLGYSGTITDMKYRYWKSPE